MDQSQKKYFGFLLYIAVVLVAFGPIYISPFIAASNPGIFNTIQAIYAPTCHQLASRSLCYFDDGKIDDCERFGPLYARESVVQNAGITGYKFPVCARDLAIYAAMILGGFAFPFVRRIDETQVPSIIFFLLALVPIGLDGGTQLIHLRESTNALRLLTGFIAGFAVPFYVIPMLNGFAQGVKKSDKKEKTT